jgi:general secretion pathway protein J
MSTTRKAAGFTLVEVLVTIVILAIIAAMAWRGVDAIVRSKDGAEQRLEAVLRLSTVVDQWEADLTNLHDAQVVPPIQFDGISLRLTRRTELGVQMVVWSLRSGVWLRWAAPPVTRANELQDMWMRSQQLLGSEPGTVAALPGIAQWQLYFWRNNAWSNPQSSGDIEAPSSGASAPIGATPPGGRQTLPQGVRLILTAAPDSGLAGSITRDIVLRSRSD